jgi:voltage-gated potassium channel
LKQKRRLWNIIRKTKVIEEMSGLLISMIIFAFLLVRIEPNINSFGDGLWYTFAVVTTIGFGDIVVVTLLGRILSVILGLYGLFIVAIITSVVVNYYQSGRNESID